LAAAVVLSVGLVCTCLLIICASETTSSSLPIGIDDCLIIIKWSKRHVPQFLRGAIYDPIIMHYRMNSSQWLLAFENFGF